MPHQASCIIFTSSATCCFTQYRDEYLCKMSFYHQRAQIDRWDHDVASFESSIWFRALRKQYRDHTLKLEFERIDFFVIASISLIENDNVSSMRIDSMNTWWNFDAKRIQMWSSSHFLDTRRFCFRLPKTLISTEGLHAVEESVQIATLYFCCF